MKYIYILFTLLLLMAADKTVAQENNVLTQGSFEQYEGSRFVGWSFPSTTYFDVCTNRQYQRTSNSNACAKIYSRDRAYFDTSDEIPVLLNGNKKYAVSIWVKGQKGRSKLTLSCYLYNGTQYVGKVDEFCTVSCTDAWAKTEGEITIPANVDRCNLRVRVSKDGGEFIYIDDITMIEKNTATVVPVLSSDDIEIIRYQRELDVTWKTTGYPKNTQWQVTLNGNKYLITSDNKCTIKGLEPSTNNVIGLSSIIGGTISEEIKKEMKTAGLEAGKQSDWRVPFLRTIGEDGRCKQTIDLFYTDLADIRADIHYWLDGVEYTPKDNKLTFTSQGEHTLEILIKETDGQEWELYYKVDVTD